MDLCSGISGVSHGGNSFLTKLCKASITRYVYSVLLHYFITFFMCFSHIYISGTVLNVDDAFSCFQETDAVLDAVSN